MQACPSGTQARLTMNSLWMPLALAMGRKEARQLCCRNLAGCRLAALHKAPGDGPTVLGLAPFQTEDLPVVALNTLRHVKIFGSSRSARTYEIRGLGLCVGAA